MTQFALCFAGRMASGKTFATTRLAERLGCPRVAFGDYVRTIARERGLDESREVLQNLGADLISDLGWKDFCRLVLAQAPSWKPGSPIVVDGIRHSEALTTLKELVTPTEVKLIFLDVDAATQHERLRGRNTGDADRLHVLETHSTEEQLKERLPAAADLLLDGRLTEDELLTQIIAWLAAELGKES